MPRNGEKKDEITPEKDAGSATLSLRSARSTLSLVSASPSRASASPKKATAAASAQVQQSRDEGRQRAEIQRLLKGAVQILKTNGTSYADLVGTVMENSDFFKDGKRGARKPTRDAFPVNSLILLRQIFTTIKLQKSVNLAEIDFQNMEVAYNHPYAQQFCETCEAQRYAPQVVKAEQGKKGSDQDKWDARNASRLLDITLWLLELGVIDAIALEEQSSQAAVSTKTWQDYFKALPAEEPESYPTAAQYEAAFDKIKQMAKQVFKQHFPSSITKKKGKKKAKKVDVTELSDAAWSIFEGNFQQAFLGAVKAQEAMQAGKDAQEEVNVLRREKDKVDQQLSQEKRRSQAVLQTSESELEKLRAEIKELKKQISVAKSQTQDTASLQKRLAEAEALLAKSQSTASVDESVASDASGLGGVSANDTLNSDASGLGGVSANDTLNSDASGLGGVSANDTLNSDASGLGGVPANLQPEAATNAGGSEVEESDEESSAVAEPQLEAESGDEAPASSPQSPNANDERSEGEEEIPDEEDDEEARAASPPQSPNANGEGSKDEKEIPTSFQPEDLLDHSDLPGPVDATTEDPVAMSTPPRRESLESVVDDGSVVFAADIEQQVAAETAAAMLAQETQTPSALVNEFLNDESEVGVADDDSDALAAQAKNLKEESFSLLGTKVDAEHLAAVSANLEAAQDKFNSSVSENEGDDSFSQIKVDLDLAGGTLRALQTSLEDQQQAEEVSNDEFKDTLSEIQPEPESVKSASKLLLEECEVLSALGDDVLKEENQDRFRELLDRYLALRDQQQAGDGFADNSGNIWNVLFALSPKVKVSCYTVEEIEQALAGLAKTVGDLEGVLEGLNEEYVQSNNGVHKTSEYQTRVSQNQALVSQCQSNLDGYKAQLTLLKQQKQETAQADKLSSDLDSWLSRLRSGFSALVDLGDQSADEEAAEANDIEKDEPTLEEMQARLDALRDGPAATSTPRVVPNQSLDAFSLPRNLQEFSVDELRQLALSRSTLKLLEAQAQVLQASFEASFTSLGSADDADQSHASQSFQDTSRELGTLAHKNFSAINDLRETPQEQVVTVEALKERANSIIRDLRVLINWVQEESYKGLERREQIAFEIADAPAMVEECDALVVLKEKLSIEQEQQRVGSVLDEVFQLFTELERVVKGESSQEAPAGSAPQTPANALRNIPHTPWSKFPPLYEASVENTTVEDSLSEQNERKGERANIAKRLIDEAFESFERVNESLLVVSQVQSILGSSSASNVAAENKVTSKNAVPKQLFANDSVDDTPVSEVENGLEKALQDFLAKDPAERINELRSQIMDEHANAAALHAVLDVTPACGENISRELIAASHLLVFFETKGSQETDALALTIRNTYEKVAPLVDSLENTFTQNDSARLTELCFAYGAGENQRFKSILFSHLEPLEQSSSDDDSSDELKEKLKAVFLLDPSAIIERLRAEITKKGDGFDKVDVLNAVLDAIATRRTHIAASEMPDIAPVEDVNATYAVPQKPVSPQMVTVAQLLVFFGLIENQSAEDLMESIKVAYQQVRPDSPLENADFDRLSYLCEAYAMGETARFAGIFSSSAQQPAQAAPQPEPTQLASADELKELARMFTALQFVEAEIIEQPPEEEDVAASHNNADDECDNVFNVSDDEDEEEVQESSEVGSNRLLSAHFENQFLQLPVRLREAIKDPGRFNGDFGKSSTQAVRVFLRLDAIAELLSKLEEQDTDQAKLRQMVFDPTWFDVSKIYAELVSNEMTYVGPSTQPGSDATLEGANIVPSATSSKGLNTASMQRLHELMMLVSSSASQGFESDVAHISNAERADEIQKFVTQGAENSEENPFPSLDQQEDASLAGSIRNQIMTVFGRIKAKLTEHMDQNMDQTQLNRLEWDLKQRIGIKLPPPVQLSTLKQTSQRVRFDVVETLADDPEFSGLAFIMEFCAKSFPADVSCKEEVKLLLQKGSSAESKLVELQTNKEVSAKNSTGDYKAHIQKLLDICMELNEYFSEYVKDGERPAVSLLARVESELEEVTQRVHFSWGNYSGDKLLQVNSISDLFFNLGSGLPERKAHKAPYTNDEKLSWSLMQAWLGVCAVSREHRSKLDLPTILLLAQSSLLDSKEASERAKNLFLALKPCSQDLSLEKLRAWFEMAGQTISECAARKQRQLSMIQRRHLALSGKPIGKVNNDLKRNSLDKNKALAFLMAAKVKAFEQLTVPEGQEEKCAEKLADMRQEFADLEVTIRQQQRTAGKESVHQIPEGQELANTPFVVTLAGEVEAVAAGTVSLELVNVNTADSRASDSVVGFIKKERDKCVDAEGHSDAQKQFVFDLVLGGVALLDKLLFAIDKPLDRVEEVRVFVLRGLLLSLLDELLVSNKISTGLAIARYNDKFLMFLPEGDRSTYALLPEQEQWVKALGKVLESEVDQTKKVTAWFELFGTWDNKATVCKRTYGPVMWGALDGEFAACFQISDDELTPTIADVLRACPDAIDHWPKTSQQLARLSHLDESELPGEEKSDDSTKSAAEHSKILKAVLDADWKSVIPEGLENSGVLLYTLFPNKRTLNDRTKLYENLALDLFRQLPLIKQYFSTTGGEMQRLLREVVRTKTVERKVAIDWSKLDIDKLISFIQQLMAGIEDPHFNKRFRPSYKVAMQFCLLGLCKEGLTPDEYYQLKLLQAGLLFRGDPVKQPFKKRAYAHDNPVAAFDILYELCCLPNLSDKKKSQLERLLLAVLNEIGAGIAAGKGKKDGYDVVHNEERGEKFDELSGGNNLFGPWVDAIKTVSCKKEEWLSIFKEITFSPQLTAEAAVNAGIQFADIDTSARLFLTSNGAKTGERQRLLDTAWRLIEKNVEEYLNQKECATGSDKAERTERQQTVYLKLYTASRAMLVLALLRNNYGLLPKGSDLAAELNAFRQGKNLLSYVPLVIIDDSAANRKLSREEVFWALVEEVFRKLVRSENLSEFNDFFSKIDQTEGQGNSKDKYCQEYCAVAEILHAVARETHDAGKTQQYAQMSLLLYIRAADSYPHYFTNQQFIDDFHALVKNFFRFAGSQADTMLYERRFDPADGGNRSVLRDIYFNVLVGSFDERTKVKQLLEVVFELQDNSQLTNNPAFVLLKEYLQSSGFDPTKKALEQIEKLCAKDSLDYELIYQALSELVHCLATDLLSSNTIEHAEYFQFLIARLQWFVFGEAFRAADVVEKTDCLTSVLSTTRALACSAAEMGYDLSKGLSPFALERREANHLRVEDVDYLKHTVFLIASFLHNPDDRLQQQAAMDAANMLPQLVVMDVVTRFRNIYLEAACQDERLLGFFKGLPCDSITGMDDFARLFNLAGQTVDYFQYLRSKVPVLNNTYFKRIEIAISLLQFAQKVQIVCERLRGECYPVSANAYVALTQLVNEFAQHERFILQTSRAASLTVLTEVTGHVTDHAESIWSVHLPFSKSRLRAKGGDELSVMVPVINAAIQNVSTHSPWLRDVLYISAMAECGLTAKVDDHKENYPTIENILEKARTQPLIARALVQILWHFLLRAIEAKEPQKTINALLAYFKQVVSVAGDLTFDDTRSLLLMMLPPAGHINLSEASFSSKQALFNVLADCLCFDRCRGFDNVSTLKQFWMKRYLQAQLDNDFEMIRSIDDLISQCDEATKAEILLEKCKIRLGQEDANLVKAFDEATLLQSISSPLATRSAVKQWFECWLKAQLVSNPTALKVLADLQFEAGQMRAALSSYRQLLNGDLVGPSLTRAEGQYYILLLRYCHRTDSRISYDDLLKISEWVSSHPKEDSTKSLRSLLAQYTHCIDAILQKDGWEGLGALAPLWFAEDPDEAALCLKLLHSSTVARLFDSAYLTTLLSDGFQLAYPGDNETLKKIISRHQVYSVGPPPALADNTEKALNRTVKLALALLHARRSYEADEELSTAHKVSYQALKPDVDAEYPKLVHDLWGCLKLLIEQQATSKAARSVSIVPQKGPSVFSHPGLERRVRSSADNFGKTVALGLLDLMLAERLSAEYTSESSIGGACVLTQLAAASLRDFQRVALQKVSGNAIKTQNDNICSAWSAWFRGQTNVDDAADCMASELLDNEMFLEGGYFSYENICEALQINVLVLSDQSGVVVKQLHHQSPNAYAPTLYLWDLGDDQYSVELLADGGVNMQLIQEQRVDLSSPSARESSF